MTIKPKIKLSVPAFNELAEAMKAAGYELGVNVKQLTELTFELGNLERPIDWRSAQVRKDCLAHAITMSADSELPKSVTLSDTPAVLKRAEEMTNFVIFGKHPEPPKTWS